MSKLAELLAEKLDKAEIAEEPYRHVLIKDFLPQDIVDQLVEAARVPPVHSLGELKASLQKEWNVQPFPGCARGWNEYAIKRKLGMPWNDPRLSGQGLALRYKGSSPAVEKVTSAMTSKVFVDAVCRKLGITERIMSRSGLQKYLDRYEISPHTDPSGKKATMLVNLGVDGERCEGTGTRLLRAKPERRYIESFWTENRHIDPDWILWDWCDEHVCVDDVNAFLLFYPTGETIHAVKCNYDHFAGQRMQVYSDIWLDEDNPQVTHRATYKALNIEPDPNLRRRISMFRQNRRIKKEASRRRNMEQAGLDPDAG